MNGLIGKTVLVTGGAQGIGKGIVRTLLERGANVAAADSDPEACAALEHELTSPQLQTIEMDVADEASVHSGITRVKQRFGALFGLVSNAAIARAHSGPFEQLSLERWNRWLAVNLTGAFLVTREALPLLKKDGGAIVNIASTRALQSEPDSEAYAASKGGLVALTHALAISLGPSVRVNCISPGWIETGDWQKPAARSTPIHSETDHRQHPAGRVGVPNDIASLVAFLLGPEAGFITGQNFIVDGGMTRKMIYAP
ncbi:SDR family oxidoreductase [Trichloromonas sp.]|uniref:SDR family oxidoreductase n=1 Tax=Trichloromonas sp. TaxID=3069249 RepID=UPI003D8132C2